MGVLIFMAIVGIIVIFEIDLASLNPFGLDKELVKYITTLEERVKALEKGADKNNVRRLNMSYMYEIKYKKTGNEYNSIVHEGGKNETEATDKAVENALTYHNMHNDDKISEGDVEVISVANVGEYDKVLKELERG